MSWVAERLDHDHRDIQTSVAPDEEVFGTDSGDHRKPVGHLFAGRSGRELRSGGLGTYRAVADAGDRAGGERFRGETMAIGVNSDGTVEGVTIRMSRLP